MLCRLKWDKLRRTNTLNQLFHCANCNQICVMQRVHAHVWLACIMLLVCGECQACGTLADSCHLLCQDPLPGFHLAVSHTHHSNTHCSSASTHKDTHLSARDALCPVGNPLPSWYQGYSLKLLLSTHQSPKSTNSRSLNWLVFVLTCSWLKLEFYQDCDCGFQMFSVWECKSAASPSLNTFVLTFLIQL